MNDNQSYELLVIRHGRSVGQDDISTYKSIGDFKIPLTELGKKQAQAASEFLDDYLVRRSFNAVRISTSECKRAFDTATIIGQNVRSIGFIPIHPDKRLDKQKFGIFDGMLSDQERKTAHPQEFVTFQKQVEENGLINARPKNGESIKDMYGRASSFAQEALEPGVCNIAVTHGLTGFCIEKFVLGLSDQWLINSMDTMKNCEIRRISVSANGASAETICADPIAWKKSADNVALRA